MWTVLLIFQVFPQHLLSFLKRLNFSYNYLIYLLLIASLFGAKYLAVLDLEAVGISAKEGNILTQRLTSHIIAISDYAVVKRANINKILEEQKFQNSACAE